MAGGLAGSAALLATGGALRAPRASAAPAAAPVSHMAWIWQFDDEGPPDVIRDFLAQSHVAAIVKTHDATDWMGTWDRSPWGVRGGESVSNLQRIFNQKGVPFYAWCVVKGLDPIAEARMAAEVLAGGAQALYIDLEPNDGGTFWQAGPAEAVAFGRELRRLQPNAWLGVSPDPRPWQVDAVPMTEFAAFCNEITPQTYWETYNNSGTVRLMRKYGFEPGPEAITPELLLDVGKAHMDHFGLPFRPIGQGNASPEGWQRFLSHAYSLGMDAVSVWRFGTAQRFVWDMLRDSPARQPAPPSVRQAPAPAAEAPPLAAAAPTPVPAGPTAPNSQDRPPFIDARAPFRALDAPPAGFANAQAGVLPTRPDATKGPRSLFGSLLNLGLGAK